MFVIAIISPEEQERLENCGFAVDDVKCVLDHDCPEIPMKKIWLGKSVVALIEREIKQAEEYFSEPISEL